MSQKNKDTSWQIIAKKYDRLLKNDGDFFHKEVILPKLLENMKLDKYSTILDIACGQGVFERALPEVKSYVGFDLSKDLINYAVGRKKYKFSRFFVADAQSFHVNQKFDTAVIILALQNIPDYRKVFGNISKHLIVNGRFYIVINHPYFRIPKYTSWEIDEKSNIQFRKSAKYLIPAEIEIDMIPHKTDEINNTMKTYSYHYSLSDYTEALYETGFLIEKIEEWTSPKVSEGKFAEMENKARNEFPVFMMLQVKKFANMNHGSKQSS